MPFALAKGKETFRLDLGGLGDRDSRTQPQTRAQGKATLQKTSSVHVHSLALVIQLFSSSP
jgi:hypothetical protein